MIIDAHTHIFPPAVSEDRDAYLRRDTTFRELYSNPKARIATAEELIASMDEAGIDKSVACGFGWSDAELCREHNDYLLEAAERRVAPQVGVAVFADRRRENMRVRVDDHARMVAQRQRTRGP